MADPTTPKPPAKRAAPKTAAVKPDGYVFGRPTKYLAEYCEQAIAMGFEGKSLVQICSAFGVTRPTLANWCETHPDFFAAMDLARIHSQAHWEELGYVGMQNRSIDASIWSRSMAARFPADWRETKTSELTGKGGGKIELDGGPTATSLLATLAAAQGKSDSE